MLTEADARARAEAILAEYNARLRGGPFAISQVEERPTGWIFYWTTARFLETRDMLRDGMAGNAPIWIDRMTGESVITGTAHEIDYYLAEYEAKRNQGE